MLAEQEASGAVGKGRAGELRDALVELRAILRAETENAAPQLGKPATDALKGDAARAKVSTVSRDNLSSSFRSWQTAHGFELFSLFAKSDNLDTRTPSLAFRSGGKSLCEAQLLLCCSDIFRVTVEFCGRNLRCVVQGANISVVVSFGGRCPHVVRM